MDDFTTLSDDELTAFITTQRERFTALLALDSPSVAEVDEAETLATEIEAAEAHQTSRSTAPDRMSALRERFATDPEADPEPEPDDGEEDEDDPAPSPDQPEDPAAEDPAAPQAGGRVATLARKTKRPDAPSRSVGMVSITAAADVPEFTSGQKLATALDIAQAAINRAKGFTAPDGDGETVDLRKFGTAKIEIPFDDDLIIDRNNENNANEVLARAADEKRLPGGSLVASAGWCAPSETVYDLSNDATDEGLISLPEVGIKRGGMRYAASPDFAAFYANPGFIQTEAQAIAGTTKPCVEVPCPTFTDVRLDAEGLCIKVPILLNAGYPEVVAQFVKGTLNAHLHWINANVIGRLVTFAGAARVTTGIGSTVGDTLALITLIADQRRQQFRLALDASMEVIIPFWVKNAMIADLALRNGRATTDPVNDTELAAHFAARKLNVQYVYDWQLLPTVDVGGTAGVDESMTYPATFDVLMYPAGAVVKGVAPVINLSTVYDAASLATNTYTGLFTEQGLLVAKLKLSIDLIRIPILSAGKMGALSLDATTAGWA